MAIWVPGRLPSGRGVRCRASGTGGRGPARAAGSLYGGLVTAARFMLNACVSVFICAESC